MTQALTQGIPSFQGPVIKRKLELGVTPTFDESFEVKISKVVETEVPTLDPREVIVTRIPSATPTLEDIQPIIISNRMSGA